MNVQIFMPAFGTLHPSAASGFVGMFNSMRPSERRALKHFAQTDPDQFLVGLNIFLERWAKNDWLEEYKVERCARWILKLCPPALVSQIIELVERKAPANDSSDCSITSKTYRVFLSGLLGAPESE
jgi:hypothetical protein